VRVDLYNSAAATEATTQASKIAQDKSLNAQAKTGVQKTETEDTTTLTSASDPVQSLTKTALETTPSRAAKVALLKQSVNDATYQLDSAKIAEALANADV